MSDFVHISDILRSSMRKSLGEEAYRETIVVNTWKAIVPSIVEKNSLRCYLSKNKFYVEIKSAALRHTLSCNQEVLRKDLNEKQNEVSISQIVFV